MIQFLSGLKSILKKETSVKIIGSAEPEYQLFLDRLGICSSQVYAKLGPWGSFILKAPGQDIALGPALASKLKVEL